MCAAMALMSFLCIFIGCYTPYLYDKLPYPMALNPEAVYHPYTAYHVSETLQILLFTALGFFLLLKKLTPEPTISLDVDWFYRMSGRAVRWIAVKPAQAVDDWVCEAYRFIGLAGVMVAARVSAWFDWNAIDGVVDGVAKGVRGTGNRLRHLQSNQMQVNILSALAALAALLLGYVFYLR
jgi:multicomponent Na+:H+ antiporter subunit D